MMPSAPRGYTMKQILWVKNAWARKLPVKKIAEYLHRSEHGVEHLIKRLRKRDPQSFPVRRHADRDCHNIKRHEQRPEDLDVGSDAVPWSREWYEAQNHRFCQAMIDAGYRKMAGRRSPTNGAGTTR